MAAEKVLTNKDLVGCIYDAGFWRSAELSWEPVNEWLRVCVRELVIGAKVNRVFRQACLVFLENAWGGYERNMRGFDKCGAECLAAQGPLFLAKARELVHQHAGWAELLFGFETPLVSEADLVDGWQAKAEIERVMKCVRPTTYEEMLYMIDRKCACCGDRCKHADSEAETAEGMHPYTGKITISHYIEDCGCAVHEQQPQCIPHTWGGHIASVAFMRDVDERYRMQLRLRWCARMLPGERDVHHFMVGARHESWFQTRIERLFELRPARIVNGLRCCPRKWGSYLRKEFKAAIFLLAPRIPNNADWSVQQIFGLSRRETLAYVRRGRLILRERRTLCTHY